MYVVDLGDFILVLVVGLPILLGFWTLVME
jgi:hypothetical protein